MIFIKDNKQGAMSLLNRLFCCVLLLLCLGGCHNKPVRHLASDVALLEVGSSSREDVLIYLGEPDATSVEENGVERWLYSDQLHQSVFTRIPYFGHYFGHPEIVKLVVVLKDDMVQDCIFSSTDEDDLDWTDDFDWQKKEETEEESGWW